MTIKLGLGFSRPELSAGAWTFASPTSQALALWLDPTDNAKITLVSGKVSSWRDKSGNSRNWGQSNATLRPVLGTGINSKQTIAVSGEGSGTPLIGPTWSLTGAEAFIVRRQTLPDSIQVGGLWRFGTGGGSFGTFELVPFMDSHNYDGFGSTIRRDTGAQPTDSFYNAAGIYSVIATASEWTSYINGVQLFTTATNTVGWCASGFVLGATGDPASPSFPMDGHLGDVLVYGGKLSPADRAAVMAALASKWNITLPP